MKRRTTLGLMAGVLATPALAACGDGKTGDGDGGAPQALTVGMPNGPLTNNSNPFTPTSSGNSLGYRWLVYEPLAQVNQIAPDQAPTPWLATAWEWAADYKSVKFTIRDGVKWSDGQVMTAEDVGFTFTLIKDNDAFNGSAIPFDAITVEGNTVSLTFTSSQFVNQGRVLETMVVPKHIWSAMSDPTTDTNQNPIGSGPYTLKSWTAQVVTMVPRTDYWGGQPKVPEVRYTSYNDNNAQTTALASGACQWSYVFMPNYQDVFVAKDKDNHKLWFPSGLGIHALFLNMEKSAFKHAALRQAINLVIDRQAIHVQGHAGLYPLVDSPTGIPRPAGEAFISDKYKGQAQAVDVEKAKTILQQGGFTLDGETLKDPEGNPVTFKLVDPAGWSDYLADLQIIADSVKQLGIDATVDTMTVDAWTEALAVGDFDASLHWTNTGNTPYDIYDCIMNGAHLEPLGKKASWNFGRYRNEDATKALNDYANASDDATRKTAMDLLQDIMVEQVPAIPLVAGPIGAEYSTKFWEGWPTAEDPYAMPQPTQPSASMIVMKLTPAS
ncbi:ABC transporter substrate-binding protein [Phytomonospora endophytica]|uniref:Peptide/nickel transport system substrate-binding protein n=1 Tax=Phytomonospora endophytica TaxID=714109 RepID=A0A841FK76_9ACTN|nr:ABC transporter substrate-binding protein [Phytomonospora endophytica]MBB6033547.1 peptide/nickel transport system substrate-binding protein [Phytomonospora endophytica]GIG64935.1 peptide ABC transporter substrate-binding protein [Phytomonospora endophytica]